MTRNSARLSLLVVAIVFFSSALPNLAPAQTVSFIDARRDFADGPNAHHVAMADVIGDALQELVVDNYVSTTVSLLLGIGDGAFLPALTVDTAGPNPALVAVGDVNGDGRPDLAVTNYGSTTVSVLLGNGD